MDAVEYVKTQFRLCRSKDSCSECPLQDKENCCCIMDTIEYVEKAVQIVEQWAKEHPVKTRQSEFLKVFPKATISNHVLSLFGAVELDNSQYLAIQHEIEKTSHHRPGIPSAYGA